MATIKNRLLRSGQASAKQKCILIFRAFVLMIVTSATNNTEAQLKTSFVFRDAGVEAGILPEAGGIYGHGAGWGDVDGNGWIDLYVATFHKAGFKPNKFFTNKNGKFHFDEQKVLQISSRATGIVFADLDNDGDLDLYISSMPHEIDSSYLIKIQGCKMFRNEGKGIFTDISEGNAACPLLFGGRSATVFDYDGDGLLDLLVGEDPMTGYNGSETRSSRIFRNKGNLKFEDVSRAVGLPEGIPGYGVSAADVNNDGWPDFFLAANDGGNVLFLNDKHGKFVEAPGSREFFYWKGSGGDNKNNMVCGVTFGDINRDGLLDMALGPHFQLPWINSQRIKLYLNKGIKNGVPVFEEITESAGLELLPMKSPHVEMQDFDNDGWPDIYTSMVKFKDHIPYPVIYKNQGLQNGKPHFYEDALAVNDFPNAEDKKMDNSDLLFKKLINDTRIIYTAPGPTADYDNDGRLDMFLPSWWPEIPSMLLHNQTPGGNWLQIRVKGPKGVNLMGVGSRIKIYKAGKLGDPSALLGCQDVSIGFGYASGHTDITHFGLGKEKQVDVEVTLPHGKGKLVQKNVKANQRIVVK
ncbi:MAG TPA: CRTAC1 family protein [Chitinophagaceae bacterium]